MCSSASLPSTSLADRERATSDERQRTHCNSSGSASSSTSGGGSDGGAICAPLTHFREERSGRRRCHSAQAERANGSRPQHSAGRRAAYRQSSRRTHQALGLRPATDTNADVLRAERALLCAAREEQLRTPAADFGANRAARMGFVRCNLIVLAWTSSAFAYDGPLAAYNGQRLARCSLLPVCRTPAG